MKKEINKNEDLRWENSKKGKDRPKEPNKKIQRKEKTGQKSQRKRQAKKSHYKEDNDTKVLRKQR